MESSHVSLIGNPCDPTALLAKFNIHQKPLPNKNIPNKTVNFTINPDGEKKHEKYPTAKYGAHQMAGLGNNRGFYCNSDFGGSEL